MSLLEKLTLLQSEGCSSADIAAFAFRDHSHDDQGADESIVNAIRDRVSDALAVPKSAVYACGSAKYGISLLHGHSFARGRSDLDLAVVDREFTERCLRAAAGVSANYSEVDAFPTLIAPGARTPYQVRQKFLECARRGVLNFSYMPLCDVRSRVKSISSDISEQYRQEFIDVSLVAYSSAGAFFDAQKQRLQQYFAKDISRSTHSSPPGYKAEEVREVNLSLQRPSFVHQDVWSALQRVRKVTGLVWCVVVPLGVVDGRESCFDILLCHQPVESINSATNGMLWEISSELGRNNVLMRFVSGSLAPTQMYSMVSSHILSIGRDYGEACLGRRVFLQLAE